MCSLFQEKKLHNLIPLVQAPGRLTLYVCFFTWRCGESEGSLLHIWWRCCLISTFWQKVFLLYNVVCISDVWASPEIALLSIIPVPFTSVKKGILRHCLLAACVAIFRHWKSTEPLHILEWVQVLNDIMAIRTLVAEDKSNPEKVFTNWICWRTYSDPRTMVPQ